MALPHAAADIEHRNTLAAAEMRVEQIDHVIDLHPREIVDLDAEEPYRLVDRFGIAVSVGIELCRLIRRSLPDAHVNPAPVARPCACLHLLWPV